MKKLYQKLLKKFGKIYRVYYFDPSHVKTNAECLAFSPKHALKVVERFTGCKTYVVVEVKK